MKKLITLSVIAAIMLSVFCFGVSAQEPTRLYVTIADENGKLAVAYKEVNVTDTDSDNLITVNDALYSAHEAYFEGGAAAGYDSQATAYGVSLMKLWGAEGLGYGYQKNNTSCMSLLDTVSEGDHIVAFVYTDMTAWSDTYCYFDKNTVTLTQGETVTLTLTASGYDASWNPITEPFSDAVITLTDSNGITTQTTAKTDAEGKATITLPDSGSFIISAKSDTTVLVPPVCLAEVKAKEVAPAPPAETKPETEPEPQKPSSPKTSDNSNYLMPSFIMGLVIILSLKGFVISYEK